MSEWNERMKIRGTRSVPKYLKNCFAIFHYKKRSDWAKIWGIFEENSEVSTNLLRKFVENKKLCFLWIIKFLKEIWCKWEAEWIKVWARGLVWIRHWPSNSLLQICLCKFVKCLAKSTECQSIPYDARKTHRVFRRKEKRVVVAMQPLSSLS